MIGDHQADARLRLAGKSHLESAVNHTANGDNDRNATFNLTWNLKKYTK
jgi:hypothetical protein